MCCGDEVEVDGRRREVDGNRQESLIISIQVSLSLPKMFNCVPRSEQIFPNCGSSFSFE